MSKEASTKSSPLHIATQFRTRLRTHVRQGELPRAPISALLTMAVLNLAVLTMAVLTMAILKVSYRELRSQLGGSMHNQRPAEAQTDWQAINLPLPAPPAPA